MGVMTSGILHVQGPVQHERQAFDAGLRTHETPRCSSGAPDMAGMEHGIGLLAEAVAVEEDMFLAQGAQRLCGECARSANDQFAHEGFPEEQCVEGKKSGVVHGSAHGFLTCGTQGGQQGGCHGAGLQHVASMAACVGQRP